MITIATILRGQVLSWISQSLMSGVRPWASDAAVVVATPPSFRDTILKLRLGSTREFYFDFSATNDTQTVRGRSLVERDLDIAGAALDREELARVRFRKTLAQTRDVKTGNPDGEVLREIASAQIGDDVAK